MTVWRTSVTLRRLGLEGIMTGGTPASKRYDPQPAIAMRLIAAQRHMTAALKILDEVDAPSDIGAHLDLALQRLQSVLDEDRYVNISATENFSNN
jgi:hypothetical protein